MVALLAQMASAQRLSVHRGTQYSDSLNTISATLPETTIHLDKAGKYLDSSGVCEIISWGLAATSVVFFYTGNQKEHSDAFNSIGVISAIAALSAKILSVSFKTKAGNELRLAAGALTLTF